MKPGICSLAVALSVKVKCAVPRHMCSIVTSPRTCGRKTLFYPGLRGANLNGTVNFPRCRDSGLIRAPWYFYLEIFERLGYFRVSLVQPLI